MNLMSFLIPLHLLSAVIWVGGMFFAHQVLRPVAVGQLEPPQRLKLWDGVFRRFFPWVWVDVILIMGTGYAMVFSVFGGFANVGVHVHIMQALGIIMVLIYMHLFFAPFKRLKNNVIIEDWPAAGEQLNTIRRMVGINLLIGLIVIVIASGGRYF